MGKSGFKKGQILLETLIAFSIAVVVLIAVMNLATRSVNNSGVSDRTSEATSYADQGINWVKSQVVLSWSDFNDSFTSGSHYCLQTLSNWTPSPTPAAGSCGTGQEISGTQFFREAVLFKLTDSNLRNYIEATVTVTWTEGMNTKTVSRYGVYYNNT